MKFGSFIAIILIFFGCAGQIPPSGGPLDLEAPKIISSSLPNNKVKFNSDKIIFEFSEYVDKRSVEESIFISPPIEGVEYDWSGTEVEIIFTKPLQKNRTYSISFGTDIVDLNNRNRMTEAFNFSFSTGNTIDKGKIFGKVYHEKNEGILVGAYKLNNSEQELNPAQTKPDYITQTGKKGNYEFQNLSEGLYRLFAFKDEYRNLKYDSEVDAIGVPPNDVVILTNDSTRNEINFKLDLEDKTSPRLLSAQFIDEERIKFSFSEIVTKSSIKIENIFLVDSTNMVRKKVKDVILTSDVVKEGIIFTEKLNLNTLVLQFNGVSDLKNNVIKNGKVRVVGGIPKIKPKKSLIYSSLSDTTFLQELTPVVKFIYNDELKYDSLKNYIKLFTQESLLVPTSTVIGNYYFEVKPKTVLNSNSKYILTLKHDSVENYKFQTIDVENFGSIYGKVETPKKDSNLVIVIETEKIKTSKTSNKFTSVSIKEKNFAIDKIDPGSIVLFGYEDKNKNGKYDFGSILPFMPAEKFTYYKDTLRIRAKWPLEGVVLNFP